jgi:hypothetical protein
MTGKLCALAAVLGLCAAATAFPQTAEQIVLRTSLFGDARNVSAKITMELKGKTGARERGLEVFIARDRGEARVLIHMVSPAFLSQMKFLTHRSASGEASSWLRTSQGVRKLSRSNGTERVFDSDFTVEDLTETDVDEFEATLLADAEIDSFPCHAVELRPKFRTQYERKVMYVQMRGSGLQGIDFLDERSGLIRQYRLLETRLADGVPFPSLSVMRDLRGGTETLLRVRELDTTTVLPEKTFNKGNL